MIAGLQIRTEPSFVSATVCYGTSDIPFPAWRGPACHAATQVEAEATAALLLSNTLRTVDGAGPHLESLLAAHLAKAVSFPDGIRAAVPPGGPHHLQSPVGAETTVLAAQMWGSDDLGLFHGRQRFP